MKHSLFIYLFTGFIVIASISCKEDVKGVCIACCNASNENICYSDFTAKKCREYNDNKVDGHTWTFRDACPLTPPANP